MWMVYLILSLCKSHYCLQLRADAWLVRDVASSWWPYCLLYILWRGRWWLPHRQHWQTYNYVSQFSTPFADPWCSQITPGNQRCQLAIQGHCHQWGNEHGTPPTPSVAVTNVCCISWYFIRMRCDTVMGQLYMAVCAVQWHCWWGVTLWWNSCTWLYAVHWPCW